ncbi:hypothetical protein [Pedobacter sp.]|uniref:hypothetical protein n=1 Tax=Pedobacter sp. TaxID=1411316 RepID=UPI003D7F3261
MKKVLLTLSLSLLLTVSFGQFNPTAIENHIRPDSAATGQLQLNFYNFNYVRNYEYTNEFHDGYTLYGTQLQPQLVYQAHPNLAITAGAFIRKDFGDNGIYDAKPLFSLIYSKKDLTLIFGSLQGGINHDYIEPLYNFEQQITNPIEYGTQLLVEKEKFKLDAWIAWQKMIYKGDATKEEIVGGLTTETTLSDQNGLKLSIPAQFMVYHEGGQIDVLKEIPITTLFNGATGFKLRKVIDTKIKSVYTDNYLAVYKDFSSDKRRAYQGGFGIWLNAGMETTFGSFVASYWKGNRFISIKGMPLYESVSNTLNHQGYTQQKRNIVSLRYAYQKELIPNLYLDVRLEPHIDLDQSAKQLQFNHSFFLIYKQNFTLFKPKK